MNWLSELVNLHNELESPESFWFWSGLSSIAAVVKDQVWLERQIHNLYPNIYVMLHAKSGLKKGPPISMAGRLVGMVNNTMVISGRSSIQGILKEMGTAKTVPGGKVQSTSNAFICSSELTSSIVEDKVATTILTDLYDRQYRVGEWKSLLKMETFTLKNPTLTILTATNESHSEDFFTKKDIQGGYFARTFIIYEETSDVINSLIAPLTRPIDYNEIVKYLKDLANLKGPFQRLGDDKQTDICPNPKEVKLKSGTKMSYFSDAGLIYDDWYQDFSKTIRTQDIEDPTGTLNRFGDSVIKVAMLLSLAKEPNLIIDTQTMTEAIRVCEQLLGNIRRTTLGKSGLSLSSNLKTMIIYELLGRSNHQVSRTILMKKLIMHFSSTEEFDDMMLSFDSSGMIRTQSIGNQILYTMPDEQVKEMKRFLSGKNR